MKNIPKNHLLMYDTEKNEWFPWPVFSLPVGLRCACHHCKVAFKYKAGKNYQEWFE